MVVGAEQQAGNMWHCQSDESHRSAESSGDGSQDTRHDQQPVAGAEDIDAQVLGILVAQHQGVQRFDKQQRTYQTCDGDGSKDGHGLHRHPAKGAHAPDHIRFHPFVGSKEIEQRNGGVADIADHDADDEQHHVVADDGREEEDEGHHRHGTHEGSRQDGHKARETDGACCDTASQEQHDQSHAKSRTTINTEDARASQRIAEGRL